MKNEETDKVLPSTDELSEEQHKAMWDFKDGLLELVEDLVGGEVEIPHYEVIYDGVHFFAKMAFDLAPSEEVARETIKAGIETAYTEWVMEERECCPNCSVTH